MAKTLTKKQRERMSNTIRAILIVLVTAILLFPLFIMFIRSLMSYEELYDLPKLLPSGFEIKNFYYKPLFDSFMKWGGNTLTIAVLNIIGIVSSAFLCAYGFAKVHFKFKRIIFGVMMASTMLPSITLRIPLYRMYYTWGWLEGGSLKPLVVPAFFGGGALNIFLVMQFIKGIPNSTLESARMDGANELRCLWSIVLPSCVPIVALISVNTFLGVWNDYSGPLIYLGEYTDKWTLALGYFKEVSKSSSNNPDGFTQNRQMAMGILMCIPPLIVFGCSQSLLIEGVSISGMKA